MPTSTRLTPLSKARDCDNMKYVLITAARNEEAVIQSTLQSVTTQARPPERWVIVDDGSTDRTADIVAGYAARHPWIELIVRPPRSQRSFAGKANAVNSAFEHLDASGVPFDVVANLDADVSFESDYMAFLLERFASDDRLGVAGTPFTQDGGYDSSRDSFEGQHYVAGPCQLFRRECFRDIGGYVANPAGGVDWIAVMTARMKGWTVRAFPEKRFHHHRTLGTAERGPIAALFSYGQKDYYLGGSPVWQLFRGCYQTTKRPFVVGGTALLAGYAWAAITRERRVVSPELMRFHRADQMRKLRTVLGALFRLRRVDAFALPGSPGERGRHA
jgi:glycosyltransferase involved in cell wall biosynthesis